MRTPSLYALGLICALASLPASGRAETCRDLLLPSSPERFGPSITADDLVQLRDIGPLDPTNVATEVLSVSPDGKHVAVQVRKADLSNNSYCLGIIVAAVAGSEQPVLLDAGGDYMLMTRQVLGFPAFTPSGAPIIVIPKWSPDGKSLAYLRREGGLTQAWLVGLDGAPARAVTHMAFDVEDVAWSPDGARLIISGRPGLQSAYDGIEHEGKGGFLFDDRFIPANSNRPIPREKVDPVFLSIGVADGDEREATPTESTLLFNSGAPGPALTGKVIEANQTGRAAWIAPTDPSDAHSAKAVYSLAADGSKRRAVLPRSSVVTGMWWIGDGSTLIIATLEGWGYGWDSSRQGFYKWLPDGVEPERFLSSADVFIGCQMSSSRLVCGHEAPTQPRELVSVEIGDGSVHPIWDPNPEFRSIALGKTERLQWKNDRGIETFGDLVLPPDHKPGQTHPLIIVQYRSRGFLRGGTGDEYPIQLYASRGFAVLRFNHPASLANFPSAKATKSARSSSRDRAGRQSIQSALEEGVKAAIATGTIDKRHIGITGLSDGATTVQFALLNSSLFSAAAISTCCDDPAVMAFLGGPVLARSFAESGHPTASEPDAAFWQNYSFARTAAKGLPPLLIQAADTEYLGALEGYQALRERRNPLEMYVFPDEFHVKWQPIHRRAVYLRSVDWFSFWLMGIEDPDPKKKDQYMRWRTLRDECECGSGG